MSNEQRPTNRLIHEKSPYLLQHAHNPVDWYPWCDEAFEKARQTDRIVLLSIGYATCHWCHVMERESFENEETARLLNERYVAIKVDREERPDVDQIYMQALHATGQHGGWPLNMFLTPDRLPITGGTYFPPVPAYGRPSFAQILQTLADAWQNERDKLLQSANTLHDFLQRQEQTSDQTDSALLPGLENVHNALQQYKSMFDEFRGGFVANGPNKFPPSMGLLFLLEYHRRFPETEALNMVETTLDHMLRGGIYDQIGGGLARYATDHDWLVPHFEKMLYDNALFAWALVDCYRITKNERYKKAAYDIFAYIDRDMTAPDGAFYSAEDADSEGSEGKFYVWSAAEFQSALQADGHSAEDVKLLMEFWGVTARGNFEGRNILHEPIARDRFLRGCNRSADQWSQTLQKARESLLRTRSERERPLRDDKILTSWNALMISALSQAARAFQDPELAERAERAANFIWTKLREADSRLLYRRYREGDVRHAGTLSDYALLGCALLDLYRANWNGDHLQRAVQLAQDIRRLFTAPDGTFYEAGSDARDLIVRRRDFYDGVEPSGNSAAARLLLTLSRFGFDSIANSSSVEAILKAASAGLREHAPAHPFLWTVWFLNHTDPVEIALFWPPEADAQATDLTGALDRLLGSDMILAAPDPRKTHTDNPLLENRNVQENRLTAYVCTGLSCRAPAHESTEIMNAIREIRKA